MLECFKNIIKTHTFKGTNKKIKKNFEELAENKGFLPYEIIVIKNVVSVIYYDDDSILQGFQLKFHRI